MCLSVNLDFHKVKNDKPIALVAKQSILVYKMLEIKNKHYRTPYMLKGINFDDEYGMFFYKTTRFGINRTYSYKRYHYDVLRGIHSYFDFDTANCAKDYHTNFDLSITTNIHYAIIPKGSKFYIGSNYDIASSNLVVFENKAKYNENKE